MHPTIVITSGHGGAGKTTLTANLGLAIAKAGRLVCVIDADAGLRSLDAVLGMDQRLMYDLTDVARGECRLQQALVRDRRQPNLYFLPASRRADPAALKPGDMQLVVASLRESFDVILIDAPADAEEGFQVAIAAAERALVVVNPEISSVRDAGRVLGLLSQHGLRDAQLLLNRLPPERTPRPDVLRVADVQTLLGVPALAALPEDPALMISTNRGEPLVLGRASPLRRHFEELAAALGGPNAERGSVPFLGRWRSLFT